jgi:nucleotide-binding universal stress UspA family protein
VFKHILLPTDGSELSQRVVVKGIAFARAIGARVTGCHVATHNELTRFYVGSGAISKETGERIEKQLQDRVDGILRSVSDAARAAGVACDARYVNSPDPFAAIIQTAETEGCDLIFMASHGHGGIAARVLGSVTNKVLTHSTIPVMVCR